MSKFFNFGTDKNSKQYECDLLAINCINRLWARGKRDEPNTPITKAFFLEKISQRKFDIFQIFPEIKFDEEINNLISILHTKLDKNMNITVDEPIFESWGENIREG